MASEEREVARAKLNMEHGFMQSIIRNQVDRDEYDKEQKLLKVQNKIKDSSRRERPRRAAQQVYVPPHLRGKASAANTEALSAPKDSSKEDWESEQKPAIQTLETTVQVKLEFVRQDGEVRVLNIREGEDLKKVVSSFGRANGLDARLRDALYHRLSNAMKGRAA